MKYKAILFDYDGTVVDSNKVIMSSWQHMAHEFIGHDIPMELCIKTFGIPLKEGMEFMAKEYGLPQDAQSIEKMTASYTSYQKEHSLGAYPDFPGMVDLIKKLYKDGFKLGIVTSRKKPSLFEGLELYDIKDCFMSIISDESTSVHKPLPDPALLCLKELGVDAKDAIMIGDSKYDIACGNNAGTDSCFVTWSFCNTIEDVNNYSPATYYVSTAEELENVCYCGSVGRVVDS